MNELEELLRKRWILKSDNKEVYYKIRDSLGDVRRFATEKLGCQIIENSLLVKLEKTPAKPENFMGIEAFTSKMEYAFLCILLMFLEDKEAEEQFVLSQVTEYIAANMVTEKVDWTLYTCRRQLIKVLRYGVQSGMMRITDGSDDVFANDYSGEVLYENTGVSKYYMRNFTRDIMNYTQPSDFENSDWVDLNEEKGMARRHRVYKRLLFSIGMYREGEKDEDFEYLKYYGKRLSDDLERTFDCRLQQHKNSAFLIAGPECKIGSGFPENNTLSDIILLCNQLLWQAVKEGLFSLTAEEYIRISEMQFDQIIEKCREEHGSGFSKIYREKTPGELIRLVKEEMERLTFIIQDKENREIKVMPVVGKVIGCYPKDYKAVRLEERNEQQMAGQ